MNYTPHPQFIEDTAEQTFQYEITKLVFQDKSTLTPNLEMTSLVAQLVKNLPAKQET